MGQRQDKTEIEYGANCIGGFPVNETPKYLYARFSGLTKCPDPMRIPPNDHVFKLTQEEMFPCEWAYKSTSWEVWFQVALAPNFVFFWLIDPETNVVYFEETPPGLPDEGHTYLNDIDTCDAFHGATGGIATVTWRIETISLMDLINMKIADDVFMEMRPLVDGNRVYKYCRLKDGTNVKILYEP